MHMIGKTMVAVIAAILLVFSGVSVIQSNASETEANNYMESVSKVILESNYNEDVIEDLCNTAAENGYTLTVTPHASGKPGTMQYADIELTYTYSLKLFGFHQQKTITKII